MFDAFLRELREIVYELITTNGNATFYQSEDENLAVVNRVFQLWHYFDSHYTGFTIYTQKSLMDWGAKVLTSISVRTVLMKKALD
jgi:hypothetical protein